MTAADILGAVALQQACFPAPFPEDLLWKAEHLQSHLERFSEGQFVAEADGNVIASASSLVISEENWHSHGNWEDTVGGPFLTRHDGGGTTLYGVDISVHPRWRGKGVGRALYQTRFGLARRLNLLRYGTACRLPGYADWAESNGGKTVDEYVAAVVAGRASDRTLSPLLSYGLSLVQVVHDYMEDAESGNAAAMLERVLAGPF
jgi:GNAT superfamily N-acetyltransferase